MLRVAVLAREGRAWLSERTLGECKVFYAE